MQPSSDTVRLWKMSRRAPITETPPFPLCVCCAPFLFRRENNRLGKPSRGDVSSYHPGCCTVSQQPGMLTYVVVAHAVKQSSVSFDISLPVQIQMELSQPLGQNH